MVSRSGIAPRNFWLRYDRRWRTSPARKQGFSLADRGPLHPGRLGLPSRVEIATVQNNYANYQVVHRVAAIRLHFNPNCTSVSFATVRVLEAPSARGIIGKHIQEATMKSRKRIDHGA